MQLGYACAVAPDGTGNGPPRPSCEATARCRPTPPAEQEQNAIQPPSGLWPSVRAGSRREHAPDVRADLAPGPDEVGGAGVAAADETPDTRNTSSTATP